MFELLYRPRLPNGEAAPLNWCLKLYRWTNIVCWPLEDKAPDWFRWADRCFWFLGFAIFLMYNDAEIRYFCWNINNIDDLLTGVPTYLVLIEIHLRAFSLGWRKEAFKKLLKTFYAEIYIEESKNAKIFKRIQCQMRLVLLFSTLYLCAVTFYILTAMDILARNKRELLYKMIPRFEYQNSFFMHLLLLLSNVWTGILVSTIMLGEGNTIGLLIYHLNGRYLAMRETLNNQVERVLANKRSSHIFEKYERILLEALRENMRLNKFAQDVQQEFSFRVFIMFAFSAMTLCALGFKVYKSPINSIGYIFWAIGKILEILAFGQIGSTIINTTNQLSSLYYDSKWENVLVLAANTEGNVHVMKLVHLSMVVNRKDFHFTGLNFFDISLVSGLKVLRGAASYFTFLISIR